MPGTFRHHYYFSIFQMITLIFYANMYCNICTKASLSADVVYIALAPSPCNLLMQELKCRWLAGSMLSETKGWSSAASSNDYISILHTELNGTSYSIIFTFHCLTLMVVLLNMKFYSNIEQIHFFEQKHALNITSPPLHPYCPHLFFFLIWEREGHGRQDKTMREHD